MIKSSCKKMTLREFKNFSIKKQKKWFYKETMRQNKIRLAYSTWNGDGLFISSEQFKTTLDRTYTIRRANLKSGEVSGIESHYTMGAARSVLNRIRLNEKLEKIKS